MEGVRLLSWPIDYGHGRCTPIIMTNRLWSWKVYAYYHDQSTKVMEGVRILSWPIDYGHGRCTHIIMTNRLRSWKVYAYYHDQSTKVMEGVRLLSWTIVLLKLFDIAVSNSWISLIPFVYENLLLDLDFQSDVKRLQDGRLS
jgi:hypothetical protein